MHLSCFLIFLEKLLIPELADLDVVARLLWWESLLHILSSILARLDIIHIVIVA